MINHVEGLSQVQEDHPTDTTPIDYPINIIDKFDEAGTHGATSPQNPDWASSYCH